MRLLVISPCGNIAYAERMIATARRVGIDPMLYGLDSHHAHGKDYQGSDIVKILTERTDAEYVMGVDAYDVAFLCGEEEILEKLWGFGYPFVVSAERDGVTGIRRTKGRLQEMCDLDGGYHAQLNIGGWIGRRDYALLCFNEAERLYASRPEDPNYSYDNHFQYLAMMRAWGGMAFHIDWHCKIFQSMAANPTVEMVEKRAFNSTTKTWPAVLHYNGDPTRQAYGGMVKYLLEG